MKYKEYWIGAVLSVLVGLLLILGTEAHHTDADPCEPVSGVTDFIENAGAFDFNIIENKGWHNSRACVRKKTKQLEGFVWNTNLGYVNFSCRDYGAGVLTSIDGLPCGTIKYGSGVAKATNGNSYLVGYGWGDNIGWISLACLDFDGDGSRENYKYGAIQSANKIINCSNVDYGILVDPETGDLSGYGYSDHIGWMNFKGAKIPAQKVKAVSVDKDGNVLPPGAAPVTDDPTIGGSISVTDPNYSAIYSDIRVDLNDPHVYANGQDAYLIKIQVKRGDAVLACDPSIAVSATFYEDVDFDQTDNRDEPRDNLLTPVSTSAFNCANDVWTAVITSTAPTTDIIPETTPNPLNNILKLTSISVSAPDLESTTIPYNEPLDFYPAIDIDKISSQNPQGQIQMEEGKLYGVSNASNPIAVEVSRKVSGGNISNNSEVSILSDKGFELASGAPALYEPWFDPECNGEPDISTSVDPITHELTQTEDPTAHVFDILVNKFLTQISAREDNTATGREKRLGCLYTHMLSADTQFETDINLKELQPVIKYKDTVKNQDIKYFTLKILKPGSLINQFAMITGASGVSEGLFSELVKVNVDTGLVDAEGNPILEPHSVVSNIGSVKATRDLRWQLIKRFAPYLRNLKNVINKNVVAGAEESIDEYKLGNAQGKILYYKVQKNASAPFKLVLTKDSNNADEFLDTINGVPYDPMDNIGQKPKTIICEGCDIYVDINVLKTEKSPLIQGSVTERKTPQLGIIALKDVTMQGDRKGGNVYVCNSVTETNLSIYADGSLYSYGGEDSTAGNNKITQGDITSCKKTAGEIGAIDSNGLPYYGDNDETRIINMKKLLKNQYTNFGTIRSLNTIGGSILTPPKTAQGETANTPALIWKAKLQDLNFMRFAEVITTRQIPTTCTLSTGAEVSIKKFLVDYDKCIQSPLWSDNTQLTSFWGYREEAKNERNKMITGNYPPKLGIVNFIGADIRDIPILGFQ